MQLDRSHATSNARAKQAVPDYMHEKKIASKRGPEAVVRLHDTHHSRRSAARKHDHKLRETSRDEKKKGETEVARVHDATHPITVVARWQQIKRLHNTSRTTAIHTHRLQVHAMTTSV